MTPPQPESEAMTGRERVQRALTFRRPDRAPRDLWTVPGIEMFRRDELDALRRRFPLDIARPALVYGRSPAERGTPNVVSAPTPMPGTASGTSRKTASPAK